MKGLMIWTIRSSISGRCKGFISSP